MCWSRPIINIFPKTKSLPTEGDAVHLVGAAEFLVWNNQFRLPLPPTTDQQKDRIINKDMTSWTTWRDATGRCYSIPIIHQTWLLPTTVLNTICEQHFVSFGDVRKGLDEWFALKERNFWSGIHKLPERWETYKAREGPYFE